MCKIYSIYTFNFYLIYLIVVFSENQKVYICVILQIYTMKGNNKND